jgi:hypothetical protein
VRLAGCLLLFAAFAGCSEDGGGGGKKSKDKVYSYESDDAPPHAASDKVWVTGTQEWSDAIHIPECDKTSFPDSETNPQCRSYSAEGNKWFYYNWPYVEQRAQQLCPSPWHVPAKEDFDKLITTTSLTALNTMWGYSGIAYSSRIDLIDDGYYAWSATSAQLEYGRGENYCFAFTADTVAVTRIYGMLGMTVRCVRTRNLR